MSNEGEPRGGDLGHAYSKNMRLIGVDDWAVFQDHDAMPCNRRWFDLIEDAIAQEPEAGAFVAVTNRLDRAKSDWQMTLEEEVRTDENDMHEHWRVGLSRRERFEGELVDVTDIEDVGVSRPFSGFSFAISRRTWDEIDGWNLHGFYQVDWAIHRRIRELGRRIFLIPAWYVYHWFRWDKTLSKINDERWGKICKAHVAGQPSEFKVVTL
jgi:GT2 family glycosyltransferase